ncbi:low choriolytic enzyme-like [Nelusetta ayraudi]|uniref:low choriolytic enzyme-like n=1 Tax=Nelusetta ayraudi TaxID=303726 RepID=UPI003F70A01B
MFHTTWLLALLCMSTACGGPINQTQETLVSTPAVGTPLSDGQNMTSPASVGVSMSPNLTQEANAETLAESDEYTTVLEGDIMSPHFRNAMKKLWTKATVPYTIGKGLADRESDIKEALQMISTSTCIQFKPRTEEVTYLRFRKGEWCASFVGCRGGSQPLFISTSCKVGNICHEVVHALGLHHEHARQDRDQHISINWENIIKGKEKNFEVKDGNTLNLPYDIDSIMHYGPYFFSKGGMPTLEALGDEKVSMGQRSHLTKLDVQKLRALYKCGT